MDAIPPTLDQHLWRVRRAQIFFAGAGALALMAGLGVPPFYPIGSGPIGGLGIIANMLLYPLTLLTLGGALSAHALGQGPTRAMSHRVGLALASLLNLGVGAFMVWGLATKPPGGSLTEAHVLALWAFGLTDAAVGLLGLVMAACCRRAA